MPFRFWAFGMHLFSLSVDFKALEIPFSRHRLAKELVPLSKSGRGSETLRPTTSEAASTGLKSGNSGTDYQLLLTAQCFANPSGNSSRSQRLRPPPLRACCGRAVRSRLTTRQAREGGLQCQGDLSLRKERPPPTPPPKKRFRPPKVAGGEELRPTTSVAASTGLKSGLRRTRSLLAHLRCATGPFGRAFVIALGPGPPNGRRGCRGGPGDRRWLRRRGRRGCIGDLR